MKKDYIIICYKGSKGNRKVLHTWSNERSLEDMIHNLKVGEWTIISITRVKEYMGGLNMNDKVISYLQKELDKCNKHYHNSYNTNTRYKWSERADMFEMLMRAVSCYEELSHYKQLDHKCRDKYGVNIASYLKL